MTTLYRWLGKLLVAGFGAAALVSAGAAPLTGSVSSAGTLCLGSTPTTPTTGQCVNQNASQMTYLDFINGGLTPAQLTPTPGQPGRFIFLTASGDLMPLIGQTGLMNDFMLPGLASPLSSFSPVNPLWTGIGTDGATYTYALMALTDLVRINGHALDLRGTGTLCRNGTDCNLFSFIFTTQDADGAPRTTYSLSQSAFATPVPEPGSLALLGLGVASLAFGARRRRPPR